MKFVKRSLFALIAGFGLIFILCVVVVGGGAVKSTSFEATTGGTSISVKDFIDKTGLKVSETEANNAIAFAERLMSRHKLTAEQVSGVLAVGYRESGFDVTAENASGGVAGFFQWSGWGSTVNGDRWAQADKRALTLEVELDLMSKELDGDYKQALEKVAATKTAFEAAKAWSQYYEGVALSDGQTKTSELEEWAKVIEEAMKSGQATYAKDNNTGTSLTRVPEGWETKGTYDGHAYAGSESYPAGQCTWYVYNRAKQLGIHYDSYMGNGGDWFKKPGYSSSQTPKVHTAVSFVHGLAGSDPTYGHVAFVEQVKDDGSILISEMNVYGQPAMTMSYRVINAQLAKQLWYVDGK